MHCPSCSVCRDRSKDCPLALTQSAHSAKFDFPTPRPKLLEHPNSALSIEELHVPAKASPQTLPAVTLRQFSQCCTVREKLPLLKHVLDVVLLSLSEAFFDLAAQQSDLLTPRNTEHVESFTHGKIGAFLVAKKEALETSKEWRSDNFLLLSMLAEFYGVRLTADDSEVL